MPLTSTIEIRFADIDKLGHVNNAIYLSYFEQARLKYFNQVLGMGIDWSETGIILARAEVDFILPIHLEDNPFIEISCTRIGTKSFDLNYQIFIAGNSNKTLATKGKSVMVCYNYKTAKTIQMPEIWIEKIMAFENKLV
ncbi:MAG: acyl-CoA thioesterase [Bacteroidetes bacterium]|nr:acyl-CoA thioesterase [Bacteroidota bacterium]HET6244581.1 thioesterase family protein [Bacteroidia bacterium]